MLTNYDLGDDPNSVDAIDNFHRNSDVTIYKNRKIITFVNVFQTFFFAYLLLLFYVIYSMANPKTCQFTKEGKDR